MKKRMGAGLAGNILVAALGFLFIFHNLVLLSILPPDIVWSRQIQGIQSNLIILEAAALVVMMLFMLIVAARVGYIQAVKWRGVVT